MSDDPMDWYLSSATNMYFFLREMDYQRVLCYLIKAHAMLILH